MTLATLKQYLQTVGTTGIVEVYFDWQTFLDESTTKDYPCFLWVLDGSDFETDIRTSTDRKTKLITLTGFAITSFDSTMDKTAVWDALEVQAVAYLNAMNGLNNYLSIENINNVKGKYIGGGMLTPDSEVGIRYKDMILKMWC